MVKQKQHSNKEKMKPKQKDKGYKNRKYDTDENANTVANIKKRNQPVKKPVKNPFGKPTVIDSDWL